jgi:hypothetical protein
MADTATRPAPLKVTVKPFKGELPKQKGPKERTPTPFDDLMAGWLPAPGQEKGEPQIAEVKYTDPAQLKPTVNQLRSALELVDTEKVYGLRCWTVEAGVIFQVGPRVRRQQKDKAA